MIKKLFLSFILVTGLCHAIEDDRRSFELDPRVRYVGGRSNLETEGGTLLTTPTKPSRATSQAVLIYEGSPTPIEEALFTEENLLIPGRDGRRQVSDTGNFPWCIHGQMSMEFGGREYGGSGVLIGPHHFLTAGHCVYKYESAEAATNIRIRLGLNGRAAIFGEVLGTKVYLYNQWMTSRSDEFDIALVILNQSIGHETGWSGLLCLDDKELRDHDVHVTGYPGDKMSGTLWTMDDRISRVEREKVYYPIDTCSGQSGGAIWIKKWGMPYVLGNHAYGGTLSSGGNFGTRLSERKIRDLVEWIGETLIIEEPRATGPVIRASVSASRGSGPSAGAGSGAAARGSAVSPPPGAGAGAGTSGGSVVPRPLGRAIPPIAIGHEAEYEQFLRMMLVYKPNADDTGRVDIPVSTLVDPLSGTFDLNAFGYTGKYISIHTGYQKRKIPANANKLEIWICPKFLAERELGTTARHLAPIMSTWSYPVGFFWTWEKWSDLAWYYYLTTGDVGQDTSKNLYKKWARSRNTGYKAIGGWMDLSCMPAPMYYPSEDIIAIGYKFLFI